MNNHALQTILANNVVELTFVRRNEKIGWSNVRGLLGTTNPKLLNGEFGKYVLHFQPPKGVGMGYDYKSKNLCVVWDFFRQEYRVFGAEQVSIRKLFDLTNPEEENVFYDWFYDHIINMSEQRKLDFMGYEGEAYAATQMARRQPQQPAVQPQAPQQPQQAGKVPMTKRIATVYQNIKNYMGNFMSKFRKK